MKRAYAFILLSAFALALVAGMSAYAWALAGRLEIDRSAAYGEPSAVSGAAVRIRSQTGGHMVFDSLYYPGSGACDTSARWSMPEFNAYNYDAEYLYRTDDLPAMAVIPSGFNAIWSGESGNRPVADHPVYQEIFDSLMDSHPDGEPFNAEVLLNDYTDRLPLLLNSRGIYAPGGEAYYLSSYVPGLEEALSVPLPGEVRLRASYTVLDNGQASMTLSPADGGMSVSFSVDVSGGSSVFAPCGYMYFVFDARTGTGMELLDGSGLPGGDWGVFRVECGPATGVDTASERWWASENLELVSSLDGIENVLAMGGDWDGAALDLSYDGNYVLLYTLSGGAIRLTAVDAASGAQTDSFELFTAQELEEQRFGTLRESLAARHSADGSVFVLRAYSGDNGLAAAYGFSGGEFSFRFKLPMELQYAPDWFPDDETGTFYDGNATDFLYCGGKLYVLYDVYTRFSNTDGEDYGYSGEGVLWRAVTACGPGGVEYAEWFRLPGSVRFGGSEVTSGFALEPAAGQDGGTRTLSGKEADV